MYFRSLGRALSSPSSKPQVVTIKSKAPRVLQAKRLEYDWRSGSVAQADYGRACGAPHPKLEGFPARYLAVYLFYLREDTLNFGGIEVQSHVPILGQIR